MHALKTKISTHQNKLKNLSTRIFNGKSLILSQSTPYEVIETFDLTQIRYYTPEVRKYKEPLVFVVPLAINMSIYDLYPYRSLVKYFQQQGFAVYVIDWGKLNIHNRHFNFLTFIDHYIP
ncbi:MAG: alpha/beta hydrolase, partial [Acinetobacter sp.]|nr:alpha/beta hydrolase [Acinetobacter sp.]